MKPSEHTQSAATIAHNATHQALAALPSIPRSDNEPVFAEPWQAEAFGLTLALHQAGVFTWQEWADALSTAIRDAQAKGDPDTGNTYYRHWLDALEKMVVLKQLSGPEQLQKLSSAWQEAAERTPHGAPIELAQNTLNEICGPV